MFQIRQASFQTVVTTHREDNQVSVEVEEGESHQQFKEELSDQQQKHQMVNFTEEQIPLLLVVSLLLMINIEEEEVIMN